MYMCHTYVNSSMYYFVTCFNLSVKSVVWLFKMLRLLCMEEFPDSFPGMFPAWSPLGVCSLHGVHCMESTGGMPFPTSLVLAACLVTVKCGPIALLSDASASVC